MDNHRAALWCWLRHVNLNAPHSFFHIDRHPDALQSRLDEWLANLPPSWTDFSIQEYLDYQYEPADGGFSGNVRLFRWDNYVSIYLAVFGASLRTCYFATHRDGDDPKLIGKHLGMWKDKVEMTGRDGAAAVLEVIWPGMPQGNVSERIDPHSGADGNYKAIRSAELWDLPSNLDYWLEGGAKPWIINIDLDYFFWNAASDERPGLMVSGSFLQTCFRSIRRKIEDQTVAVTTIALTPSENFTGGWTQTEELAAHIMELLGIEFRLP